MNISHTKDKEQHFDDEVEYTKAFLKNTSGQPLHKSSNIAVIKAFELLDDSTPNYVLGYN